MQIVLKIALAALVLSSLVGCSSFRFPGVYRVNVQQGNYIEQDKVDQLEIGMTKKQVQFIMGTPSIKDTFNQDRWDYYFSLRRGDKLLKNYRLTTHFEDDKLARWSGDYEPAKKDDDEEAEDKAQALEDARKKEAQKF